MTNTNSSPTQKHFQYSLPLHANKLRDMAETLTREANQKRHQANALLAAAAELEMAGGIYAPQHEEARAHARIALGFALENDAEREAARPKPQPKPQQLILDNTGLPDFDNM